jgi:RND family efflux transporter MFP subunit
MKKIFTLIVAATILASCGNTAKKEDGLSIDQVIEGKDLTAIKAKKDEVLVEYNKISDDISKLDKAIEKLDTVKKLPIITAFTVQKNQFKHYIDIQGDVATRQNVIISPEVQGGMLKEILVNEGDRVSKGQLLARIDDGGLRQQLAQAEAQAELAKTTFERQERLWEQKVGSEIQFLQAKTNNAAAQKQVEQLKIQLGKSSVRAPFSGVIDDIIAEQGEVVGTGSPLMRIVNLSNMYVKAEVPETYLGRIKEGSEAQVEMMSLGKAEDSKVRQVGNFINPANRTFSIEVPVSSFDGAVKPNLTVNLKLNDYQNEEALLIPDDIIQENARAEKYVFVLENRKGDEAKLKKVEIKTGYSYGDKIEVLSGISEGTVLVHEGAKSMRDGLKVKVKS